MQESRIRKLLFNEVTLAVAVVTALWNVYGIVRDPQITSAEHLLKLDGRLTTQEKLTTEQINTIKQDIRDIKEQQTLILKALNQNYVIKN